MCYFCLTLVFRIFGEHKQRLMMAITVMSIVLLLMMVMMTTMIAVTIMDDYAPAGTMNQPKLLHKTELP